MPNSLTELATSAWHSQAWSLFADSWWRNLSAEVLRYGAAALFFWLTLHVLLRRRWAHRLIRAWGTSADRMRELTYSASSILILATSFMCMEALSASGRFDLYTDPRKHGWVWLCLSGPLLVVWHDAYFYWTHRLLHTRWLFVHVHGVRHRSQDPSPWAAYALHPIEVLVVVGYIPLFLWVAPLHLGVFP